MCLGIEKQMNQPKAKFIDRANSYKNDCKTCKLCLAEQYHIITSKLPLLNKRTEFISKCRHLKQISFNNYKYVPTD